MNDNDNFLDEIFHEARRGLSPESLEGSEDSQVERCSSLENLNISASDIWKWQDDAFGFACRKIKHKAGEIEKRLNKITSADILASLNVSANANGVNGVSQELKKEPSHKKRVRFLFPDVAADSSLEKRDKVDSLLYRIRRWLEPNAATYQPRTDVSRNNKILSAYWDAVRVVGQGRTNSEVTVYNNPFDPRLQFNGLAHHVIRRGNQREFESDPGGNALLWLDKVSDMVDECLQKYTNYLKSLREESVILREAIEKTEVARSSASHAGPSSSVVMGCEFGPYHQGSGDVSADEEAMVGKLRSVKKLWEDCAESHGAQIPRRITARKPPIAPRRRVQVMSEVKTSSWPTVTILGRGDVCSANKPSTENRTSKKKPSVSPDMPPSKLDEFADNGRKSPRVWQRIAEQHIDEESLKHLKNATKERVGVKIMRPTVTTASREATMSKSDSWAARVAQHIYTTATAHTKAIGTVTQISSGTKSKVDISTSNILTVVSQTKVVQNQTDISTDNASIRDVPKATDGASCRHEPTTVSGGSRTENRVQGNDQHSAATPNTSQSAVNVTAAVSHATEVPPRDPFYLAKASSLNPLNSSPEWLRKLIARTSTKSTFETKTTSRMSDMPAVSQELKVPVSAPSTTSDYRSSHQGADDTQQQVGLQETRCRVPPGFEKTVLETTVGAAPPPAHQQQRAVHMPAAHTWQQPPPSGIFTGMNGETFIQPTATYQATRVIHQFQRPVPQMAGNIAIWHPRPPHGGYMLTDMNGKAVGVGIPGWNRVDIQGRPHVLVHQPHLAATAIRATMRPPHVFPPAPAPATANPEHFTQQSFSAHHVPHQPVQHPPPGKMSETPNGAAGGYERGDHYSGFTGGIPPPQVHYQSRLVPQFVPGMQHPPPMMQTEYAVYTTQNKTQAFTKPNNVNQNNDNGNSGSGSDNGSVADPLDVPLVNDSEEVHWTRPRHETRTYRTSRAIRSNLIQLA